MKFKVMFNFLLYQMYCYRRGNGQKPTRTKPPGQRPLRTIEIEFVQGTFVRDFCTRPTKNRGGGPRCVTYFRERVPGCVTKWDRGRGSKLAKNSVTYFMDGLKISPDRPNCNYNVTKFNFCLKCASLENVDYSRQRIRRIPFLVIILAFGFSASTRLTKRQSINYLKMGKNQLGYFYSGISLRHCASAY